MTLGHGVRSKSGGLEDLASECMPYDDRIRQYVDGRIPGVTDCISPMLTLTLTTLLRWPDWSVADRCAGGFWCVGEVPSGNIYDPIPRRAATDASVEQGADDWNYECHLRRKPQATDDVTRAACDKEISKG